MGENITYWAKPASSFALCPLGTKQRSALRVSHQAVWSMYGKNINILFLKLRNLRLLPWQIKVSGRTWGCLGSSSRRVSTFAVHRVGVIMP